MGAGSRRHHAQGVLRQRRDDGAAQAHAEARAEAAQAYIRADRLHPRRHIRFHIGDKSVVLGPGGLLQIPPDVMHWGEVVGDEPVLNLDIFTPVREEYAPPPSA